MGKLKNKFVNELEDMERENDIDYEPVCQHCQKEPCRWWFKNGVREEPLPYCQECDDNLNEIADSKHSGRP